MLLNVGGGVAELFLIRERSGGSGGSRRRGRVGGGDDFFGSSSLLVASGFVGLLDLSKDSCLGWELNGFVGRSVHLEEVGSKLGRRSRKGVVLVHS